MKRIVTIILGILIACSQVQAADITLVANTNYSTLTVANGDRILLAGYQLTLSASPAQTNVTVDATGNAGTVITSTVSSFTLTGWVFRAGTVVMCDTTFARFGCSFTGATFIGGSAANARAVTTNTGSLTFTNCTFTAGSASGTHGVYGNSGANYFGCTFNGAGISGAHGVDASVGRHVFNGACTFNGGAVSGSYGGNLTYVLGLVDSSAVNTTVSGAYGINCACVAILDARKLSGVCVNRATNSVILLYGDTSTANLNGSAGTLRMIPKPSDVRLNVSVMGETGTFAPYPAIEGQK